MKECPRANYENSAAKPDAWQILVNWYDLFSCSSNQWIFRGQRDCTWDLQSTLEREIVSFTPRTKRIAQGCRAELRNTRMKEYSKILGAGFTPILKRSRRRKINANEVEQGILREFQRRCYHYLSDLPPGDCTLEWLALMRHYGAPTRLVDWTYSFFVAVFHAVEKSEGACALYAINADELDKRLRTQSRSRWRRFHKSPYVDRSAFEDLFGPRSGPAVYAINPFRLNQRLTAQQGLFLAPAQLGVPFNENLNALFRRRTNLFFCQDQPPRSLTHAHKIVISTTVEKRSEILRHLQDMNINKATLFTDLAGFAESLRTRLAFPDILVSDDFASP